MKINLTQQTLKQYHDVETRECVLCNSLVDDNLDYPPLVRKAQFSTKADEKPTLEWKAYHATCLGE